MKDPIPNGLRSCVVYKFSCAACYVGETTWHFNPRFREHLETDRVSHNLKHLEGSSACSSTCSRDNVAIIDQPSSLFALKMKERRCTYFGTGQHSTHRSNILIQIFLFNFWITIVTVLIIAIIIIVISLVFILSLEIIVHTTLKMACSVKFCDLYQSTKT